MTNNDVLRRVRYIFDFNDNKMMALFALSDYEASREDVSSWLKQDDAEGYKALADKTMALFLNGLIIDKRGKREGPAPAPETTLTNNMIFMKLKIALDLHSDEVLMILGMADFRMSKHELSALFRKPSHKNFKPCKDQILRNFLTGLKLKYRDNVQPTPYHQHL